MTGCQQLLLGSAGKKFPTVQYNVSFTTTTGTDATAGIGLGSDGQVWEQRGVVNSPGGNYWVVPAYAGVGGGYWGRATLLSGGPCNGPFGSPVNLGSTVMWTLPSATSGNRTAQIRIEVLADSGGSVVLSTGVCNITCNHT